MTTPPYILIADDEPTVRHIMVRVVKRVLPHATIVGAASGTEALAALPRHHYTAILTDYHMPGASGLDVIKSARALDAAVPIIVISAHSHIESAVLAAGATHFLAKPFTIDSLDALLRSLLPVP